MNLYTDVSEFLKLLFRKETEQIIDGIAEHSAVGI